MGEELQAPPSNGRYATGTMTTQMPTRVAILHIETYGVLLTGNFIRRQKFGEIYK